MEQRERERESENCELIFPYNFSHFSSSEFTLHNLVETTELQENIAEFIIVSSIVFLVNNLYYLGTINVISSSLK